MSEPIVRTLDLKRTYKVGGAYIHAVNGISLEIEAGQYVAVRGRSGSGKTTLLNLIGGLDRPSSGTVYIKGRDLSELSDRELTRLRRHEIGFVFQSFGLLPVLSAYENVELPMRIADLPRQEREKRTRQYLEMVGLTKRADHRAYELSGGEQQRVAIARALANRPSLVLADEPTGNLDSITGWAVLNLFRDIVAAERVTIIVATHDPTIFEVASVVYEISDGAIVDQNMAVERTSPVHQG